MSTIQMTLNVLFHHTQRLSDGKVYLGVKDITQYQCVGVGHIEKLQFNGDVLYNDGTETCTIPRAVIKEMVPNATLIPNTIIRLTYLPIFDETHTIDIVSIEIVEQQLAINSFEYFHFLNQSWHSAHAQYIESNCQTPNEAVNPVGELGHSPFLPIIIDAGDLHYFKASYNPHYIAPHYKRDEFVSDTPKSPLRNTTSQWTVSWLGWDVTNRVFIGGSEIDETCSFTIHPTDSSPILAAFSAITAKASYNSKNLLRITDKGSTAKFAALTSPTTKTFLIHNNTTTGIDLPNRDKRTVPPHNAHSSQTRMVPSTLGVMSSYSPPEAMHGDGSDVKEDRPFLGKLDVSTTTLYALCRIVHIEHNKQGPMMCIVEDFSGRRRVPYHGNRNIIRVDNIARVYGMFVTQPVCEDYEEIPEDEVRWQMVFVGLDVLDIQHRFGATSMVYYCTLNFHRIEAMDFYNAHCKTGREYPCLPTPYDFFACNKKLTDVGFVPKSIRVCVGRDHRGRKVYDEITKWLYGNVDLTHRSVLVHDPKTKSLFFYAFDDNCDFYNTYPSLIISTTFDLRRPQDPLMWTSALAEIHNLVETLGASAMDLSVAERLADQYNLVGNAAISFEPSAKYIKRAEALRDYARLLEEKTWEVERNEKKLQRQRDNLIAKAQAVTRKKEQAATKQKSVAYRKQLREELTKIMQANAQLDYNAKKLEATLLQKTTRIQQIEQEELMADNVDLTAALQEQQALLKEKSQQADQNAATIKQLRKNVAALKERVGGKAFDKEKRKKEAEVQRLTQLIEKERKGQLSDSTTFTSSQQRLVKQMETSRLKYAQILEEEQKRIEAARILKAERAKAKKIERAQRIEKAKELKRANKAKQAKKKENKTKAKTTTTTTGKAKRTNKKKETSNNGAQQYSHTRLAILIATNPQHAADHVAMDKSVKMWNHQQLQVIESLADECYPESTPQFRTHYHEISRIVEHYKVCIDGIAANRAQCYDFVNSNFISNLHPLIKFLNPTRDALKLVLYNKAVLYSQHTYNMYTKYATTMGPALAHHPMYVWYQYAGQECHKLYQDL